MAGSSLTQSWDTAHYVKTWTCDWVSDDSAGTVSIASTKQIYGRVFQLITNPGSTAPTDNYDIKVLDAEGVDLLNGDGANRDTSNSEITGLNVATAVDCAAAGTVTFDIANAGNSKEGRAIFYIIGDVVG
jgi:hypothetical protein